MAILEGKSAVVTGSGLKDVRAAVKAGGAPIDLPPSDEALDEMLRSAAAGGRAERS